MASRSQSLWILSAVPTYQIALIAYAKYRIDDQLEWYQQKAASNKTALNFWVGACVIVYGVAVVCVLSRISYPKAVTFIEPLIVISSSIVGWMQIKKYSELASAFTLTAHEIGIISQRVSQIESKEQFSSFVNEAELAFSREHTQWVARQNEA